MIHIGEEATQEENVGKPEEGNVSVCEKGPPREEQAEEKTGKNKQTPISSPVAQPNVENQRVTTTRCLHRGTLQVGRRLGKRNSQVCRWTHPVKSVLLC